MYDLICHCSKSQLLFNIPGKWQTQDVEVQFIVQGRDSCSLREGECYTGGKGKHPRQLVSLWT